MSVTAACREHESVLLGGGIFVTGAGGGIPQTGVHLRGTYPSDSSGNPITSGDPAAWVGAVQTGGQPAPNTSTAVFALCARPRDAS